MIGDWGLLIANLGNSPVCQSSISPSRTTGSASYLVGYQQIHGRRLVDSVIAPVGWENYSDVDEPNGR